MADVTHKKWSDAAFFNEFYDDQNVVSIGVQKLKGKANETSSSMRDCRVLLSAVDLAWRVSVGPGLGKTAVGLVALLRWCETFRWRCSRCSQCF
jgi:hypothetical protein